LTTRQLLECSPYILIRERPLTGVASTDDPDQSGGGKRPISHFCRPRIPPIHVPCFARRRWVSRKVPVRLAVGVWIEGDGGSVPAIAWTHRLIAYGVLTAFSFVVYLLKPNPTDREFHRPSMFYLFLPPVLLIGVMFFVEGTWTWMVIAALVVGLWTVATLIVGRCVAVAPTLAWRVALVALQ
jgi:hypothetical protein